MASCEKSDMNNKLQVLHSVSLCSQNQILFENIDGFQNIQPFLFGTKLIFFQLICLLT